jgi:hypothetical protein
MPFQDADHDGGKGHGCHEESQEDACDYTERKGGLYPEEGIDMDCAINAEYGEQE